MFEKFTERSRKIMSCARQKAQLLKSEFIGTEHMLLGILEEGGGVAAKFLQSKEITQGKVLEEISRLVKPATNPTSLGQLPFSPRARRAVELATEAAGQCCMDIIGTEHILIALFRETNGIAASVLKNLGMKASWILEVFESIGISFLERSPPNDDIGMRWVVALAEGFRLAGCKRSPIVPDPNVIRECIEGCKDVE